MNCPFNCGGLFYMEIKGIDVSAWQGVINWKTVADYGMGFAILRITEQGNKVDSQFENNYIGCKNYGIPVGVYKYSYAKTVAQAQEEAEAVLNALNGRKIQFPVFYDLEWSEQRSLGKTAIEKIAVAFLEKIQAAGYKVGIYCNVDWYNEVLTDDLKKYDLWIARYPANDDGWIQERLRPDFGVGWQYSSKARIPGISGYVDRDVFYKDYADKEEEDTVGTWDKTKKLLDEQVGYLEKSSNSNLDSKSGNAGYNNYTKYARDVNNMGLMGYQGQPWCAVYQFWICAQVFGKSKAIDIMGNGFYNCNSVKAHSKAKGTWHSTPKLGALVIFRNGAHIGRVIAINVNTIRTNEGNTSSGGLNNVESNGGCVAEKSYTIGNSQIDGYVWIDYGTQEESGEVFVWTATGTATSTVDNLFVRAEPNGEVIGELMKGNRFEINGVTSGNWTQVNVANIGVGWVWTDYTKKDGVQTAEPPKQEITNKQDKTQRLFVGKVTASVLNVRTWAGTEFPQIKSYPVLARGNLVDVMNYTQTANDGSKWYYIRIAGKYHGFVSAEYIERQ